MHWQPVIFGGFLTLLFIRSWQLKNAITLAATVLFVGWLSVITAQLLGQHTPFMVYWGADIVSALILFGYLFRRFSLWLYLVALIYIPMIAAHSQFVTHNLTSTEYYWVLAGLLSVQILITGGQIYDIWRRISSWIVDVGNRLMAYKKGKKHV